MEGIALPRSTSSYLELTFAWRTVPGWLATLSALALLIAPAFLLDAGGRRARRADLAGALLALPGS